MINAIICDVDGVLIRSTDEHGKFLWSQNAKTHLGLTTEHFKQIFSEEWEKVTRGQISSQEHFQRVFEKESFRDLDVDAAQFIHYWLTNDSNLDNSVIDAITAVPLPKYIGTNQEEYRTKHIQTLFGEEFDGIFPSYLLGALKPEHAYYEGIENALQLPSEQIAFIDDTKANVTAATRRGWKALHYTQEISTLRHFLHALTEAPV